MLINEIIQPKTQQSALSPEEIKRIKNRDTDKPGTGADAIGWPSDDPHIWIKQSTNPIQLDKLSNDPTYHWIQNIKHHIPDNPYLPRTYITDLKTDDHGNIWPQYHIETLIHGTDYAEKATTQTQPNAVNKESLNAMASRMWRHPDWIKTAPYTPTISAQSNTHIIWRKCCAMIRNIIETNNIPQAKNVRLKPDPLLMQAIKLVQKTVNENPLWITDLHANNFMIRLTAHGPQLVINDPVTLGFNSTNQ
jgi:hypothetical protein